MSRTGIIALAAGLLCTSVMGQTPEQPPQPKKFEDAPATDPRILSEKASREPFGQPNGLPVFAGLPSDTAIRLQKVPRTMPPAGQVLDQAEKVNPAQQPAFPGQTRAVAMKTAAAITTRVVAHGLSHPWSLAFLPDGSMLVTEKSGTLRVVTQTGKVSAPLAGVPPVLYMGDAGLFTVLIDPEFSTNRYVYLSFVGYRPTGNALMAVRAKLSADNTRLQDVEQLLTMPAYHDSNHFGGAMLIGRDGKLYISASERITDETRISAQSPASPMGKVLRINRDGSIPDDNPYAKVIGAEPRIWTIGNRDPEGLSIEPATGKLWLSDHGPKGGDELDVLEPGHNYGWPLVAYGKHYSGQLVNGERTVFPGTEQPCYYWDPAIAPAGIAFYDAALLPEWRGNLFVAALGGKHLIRLALKDGKVTGEERLLLENNQRVRDVKQGPDGALWVITDEQDGRLIRLAPHGR